MDAVVVVVAVAALLAYAGAAAWLFDSGTPVASSLRRSMRRPGALVVSLVVAIGLLALGVPWIYAETTDEAPDELSFDDATPVPPDGSSSTTRSTLPPVTRPGTATSSRPTVTVVNPSITRPTPTTSPGRGGRGGDDSSSSSSTDTTVPPVDSAVSGTWAIGPGTIAGYRANEVLVLQRKETAGRTEQVSGSMVVEGLTVRSVDVVVDMASVRSDNPQRDEQYRGRIMAVGTFPTSEFHLTAPIELDRVPDEGEVLDREAVGDFTIRGVTRNVTFPLQARLNGGRIEVLASIPVVWSDYGIPDPSTPLTKVENHGVIELLLLFDPA